MDLWLLNILLSVTDQGPGIAPDALARIFDAFYTTRSHGIGIGLAVVRRVVDEHAPFGAAITVRSGESGGATFEVRLAPTPAPTNKDVLSVDSGLGGPDGRPGNQ